MLQKKTAELCDFSKIECASHHANANMLVSQTDHFPHPCYIARQSNNFYSIIVK